MSAINSERPVKIEKIILDGWEIYKHKVANHLLQPENEKMMQLQLAQIYQALCPLFEYERSESIKVLLEVPAVIRDNPQSIDIVLSHTLQGETSLFPIELKCFRLLTRTGDGKRGAQNLGMYDYWKDIERIEKYAELPGFRRAFQLTLTDDPYYVLKRHEGEQVSVYSTCKHRDAVTGPMTRAIARREGSITLRHSYTMTAWDTLGSFHFIAQQAPPRTK